MSIKNSKNVLTCVEKCNCKGLEYNSGIFHPVPNEANRSPGPSRSSCKDNGLDNIQCLTKNIQRFGAASFKIQKIHIKKQIQLPQKDKHVPNPTQQSDPKRLIHPRNPILLLHLHGLHCVLLLGDSPLFQLNNGHDLLHSLLG